MMVANSANLIVTVKPVNQRNNIAPPGGIGSTRSSVKSTASYLSAKSQLSARDTSNEVTHLATDDDDDIVESHLSLTTIAAGRPLSTVGENVLATV